MRRAALAPLATLALLAAAPTADAASTSTAGSTALNPSTLVAPLSILKPPSGHRFSARQVVAIAKALPKVRPVLRHHRGSYCQAFLKGQAQWQVSCWTPKPTKEIAQVIFDDQSGTPVGVWTGFQVAWTMARGYPGAFGRRADALYVWLPLCLLFIAPFLPWRRRPGLVHLDLLALLSFSVSLAFFNHANIGLSVPLAYPPLLYLLARMLWLARRGIAGRAPVRLLVPAGWLVVATIFLLGFRVGLNLTNSNVIDVGYAGVIGADKLAHGKRLYGHWPSDNEHGDTYGPVNYYAYYPFERALGWSGSWDDLPAAHGAAIAFDLLTLGGLALLGWRVRGPTLAAVLAYAWATNPFTLFASNSNSNDALVSLTVVLALLALARPAARGAAAALAGLTKFAPLALAPLLARGTDDPPRARRVALFAVAFAVVALLALLPVFTGSGLHTFYDRTLGFQSQRGSPFSLWGLYGWTGAPQIAVQAGAVLLALALAFVPRRRDAVQAAALAAAVLIALQLGVSHWFYLYIVWFLPPLLLALFGGGVLAPAPRARRVAPAPA